MDGVLRVLTFSLSNITKLVSYLKITGKKELASVMSIDSPSKTRK